MKTVKITDELHRQIKSLAADRGQTIETLASFALSHWWNMKRKERTAVTTAAQGKAKP
jgi:predicted transcriptional regulator